VSACRLTARAASTQLTVVSVARAASAFRSTEATTRESQVPFFPEWIGGHSSDRRTRVLLSSLPGK